MFLKVLTCLLPWPLRRRALNRWFHYEIHESARIGLAWIFPRKLVMAAGTRIDHFNIAIHLDQIVMGENASIGRGNWITGFPVGSKSRHFQHQPDRRPELHLGENASIAKYHHFDCTNLIEIGRFSTIGGYHSQFLTHSINVYENRQDSAPIYIGEYCFVGTNVVVLGNGSLPARSVLGAKSLLNKAHSDEWTLYGGVPAKGIQKIPAEAKFFARTSRFVY